MYKFYGQFKIDEYLNQKFIKNKKGGFFIECGAFDGNVESSCKFFEESLEWKGINIEAVPYLFDRLKENRPNSINLNYALSNANENKIFTHVVHPVLGNNFGNGSFCLPDFHKKDLKKDGCTFLDIEVKCKKLSDIFLEFKIKKVDLFVLDVEGYEINVINGMKEILKEQLPEIFCIEYPWCGLENLKNILNENYKIVDTYNNNAIFIKV